MDKIKPFSEDISYGKDEFGAGKRLAAQLDPDIEIAQKKLIRLVPATPRHAADLLEGISRGNIRVQLPVGGGWVSYPITQEYFNHAKKILKDAVKRASPSDKMVYEKFLKVKYPSQSISKAVNTIAHNTLSSVAKKESIKLTAKSIGKYLVRIAPWIAVGVVGKDLYDRVKNLITEDNKSESNNIPHGEFYHKDIGWY